MHISVLPEEVIRYLDTKTNENFIDCTVNGGGHTLEILEKTEPKGKILAIDADPELLKTFGHKLKNQGLEKRVSLVCDNFANLKEIVKKEKFLKVTGILFDLGFSSWHLENSGRGFTFKKQEPLDMRYNPQTSLTAEKILNFWSGPEIERILREYGQERFCRQIAVEIVRQRKSNPVKTTSQLLAILEKAIPKRFQHQRLHFATRTFQAMRIAVNDELNNLKKGLEAGTEILNPGGRLVVISFHSLEDGIVKKFFKEKENILKTQTKKPIIPSQKEIKINPRSRSSKLRAAIKI